MCGQAARESSSDGTPAQKGVPAAPTKRGYPVGNAPTATPDLSGQGAPSTGPRLLSDGWPGIMPVLMDAAARPICGPDVVPPVRRRFSGGNRMVPQLVGLFRSRPRARSRARWLALSPCAGIELLEER